MTRRKHWFFNPLLGVAANILCIGFQVNLRLLAGIEATGFLITMGIVGLALTVPNFFMGPLVSTWDFLAVLVGSFLASAALVLLIVGGFWPAPFLPALFLLLVPFRPLLFRERA